MLKIRLKRTDKEIKGHYSKLVQNNERRPALIKERGKKESTEGKEC